MDLTPENVPHPFVQDKDRWTRKYKSLDRYSAIALIEIDGVRTWRWRDMGGTQDWPYETFGSLAEFEAHTRRIVKS